MTTIYDYVPGSVAMIALTKDMCLFWGELVKTFPRKVHGVIPGMC